jgi:uncharacterized membrane protein
MTSSSQDTLPKPPPLALARTLSFATLFGLVLLYLVSSLMDEQINWTVLIIPCLTLLMFVPGMMQNRPRSFDWLCFVILLHFTVGVTNSMSPVGAWHDYLQTVLTTVLFISSMMTSRWLKAAQHQGS